MVVNWKVPTLVISALLATSVVVVLAGPGDGTDDTLVVVEEPDDGTGDIDGLENGDGDLHGTDGVAQAIVDAFSTEDGEILPEDILDLHDDGVGFGVLYQLLAMAAVMEDMTIEDLLALHQSGTGIGQLRKELTEDQLAALEDYPKNLGQAKSALKHADDTDGADDGTDDTIGIFDSKGKGNASVKSNGHGKGKGKK